MRRLICILLFHAATSFAATDYYVDSSRTTSGDGSEANPWKAYSDINWTTVSNALFSDSVNLYFSSRDTWAGTPGGAYTVNQSDITGENRISLIGDEKYNTTDSGTAVWSSETTTNRAIVNGGTSFYMPHGAGYITIKGFSVVNPTYGGIQLGPSSGGLPTTNIHNIIIQGCLVDTPSTNHGIWAGFAEAGCSNYTIRGNTIIGTSSEGIYMGHYNYASQTVRGIVVESNTVINCGIAGEGDIDIKPACYGAIVRYNTHYRTTGTIGGSSSGVVIGADFCQVYGNTFFAADTNSSGGWGNNIYINDAGSADAFGQAITSCKIYNNVLYSAGQNGIRVISGAYAPDPKSISGLEIYNNTIYGNTNHGLRLQVNTGSTLSAVVTNNIMSHNAGYDFYIDTTTGLTLAADYNLYYRASGNSWYRAGAITSFANWQALGYDANGINSDPLFTDTSTTNFTLTASSPARNAGVTIGAFSVDRIGTTRPQGAAWDIGAFEYAAEGSPASPNVPRTLKIRGFRGLSWGNVQIPIIEPYPPTILGWELEEGTGTALSATAGPAGTIAGGTWISGVSGESAAAYQSDTDTTCSSDSSVTYSANVITACVWAYEPSTWATAGVLLQSGNSWPNNANSWRFYNNEGELQFGMVGTTTTQDSSWSLTAPSTDTWHHYAIVYDASTATGSVKVYVDGVLQSLTPGNQNKDGTSNFASQTFYAFSQNGGASTFFSGNLDDIRIYSGEKTAQEILGIKNNPR